MKNYVIRANDPIRVRRLLAMKGGVETVQVDFSPYAEDNGNVSAVTWEVESGNAAVSSESLSSNVASAKVTTSDTGPSMLKITATSTNDTKVVHILVSAKKPVAVAGYDYGFVIG